MYKNNSLIDTLIAILVMAYYIVVGSVQKAVNKGFDKMFIAIGIGVIAGFVAYLGLAAAFAVVFGDIAILTTFPAAISAVFFGISVYIVIFDII